MVPDERPIAAPSAEGGPVPARAAAGSRLSTVRIDFQLDSRARLSEQERALMTAMLAGLVATIADEFTALLADAEPANDDGDRVFDRLWSAGLLDIPDLVALLLRRAEEERLAAGIRATRPAGRSRFLQALVSDEDGDVSAAAMALILARSRRRDRFEGPRLTFDDLSAETAVMLVYSIAAALRGDLSGRLDSAAADDRLSGAARTLLSRHDEGNRLEAKLFALVHALDSAGRVDEGLIRSALDEGEIFFVGELLARLSGIGFDSAWDHLTGGGCRLALLLRMAGLSRALSGEILGSLAEVVGSDPAKEIEEYDRLEEERVDSARKWLRLDPAYRSAVRAFQA
jgi:hypothetical protein